MRKTGVAVSIDGLIRRSSMSRSQSCLHSASVPSLMMRLMWSVKVASWSALISSGAVSMRSWSSSRRRRSWVSSTESLSMRSSSRVLSIFPSFVVGEVPVDDDLLLGELSDDCCQFGFGVVQRGAVPFLGLVDGRHDQVGAVVVEAADGL
jgi:hypothetical protein